jgi:ABC-type sugar transport system substrate-binding protein
MSDPRISFIQRGLKPLVEYPKVVALTAVSLFVTIGGIVQSGEYLQKYFPGLIDWIHENRVTILIAFGSSVTVLLLLFMILYGRLQNDHELLRRGERERQHNEALNKIVLFLSPCQEGGFYLQHFSHLVRSAAEFADVGQQIHITLLCPSRAFQGRAPETLLDSANAYPAKVSGVFIIPADPDKKESQEGILKFKKKYPATVLLDVYPGAVRKEVSPGLPDFVGGDEALGGELAAALAKRYLGEVIGKRCFRVLILIGRTTEWEMQRVNAFKESFKSGGWEIQENTFTFTNDLHYQKEKAKEEIEARISNNELSQFDLIYACNDEMAIGALEALEAAEASKRGRKVPPKRIPKLIGYDGTPEMRRLIAAGNPYILGTVDVDIEEQASSAIRKMSGLLRGEEDGSQRLIPPRLVPNDAVFSGRRL